MRKQRKVQVSFPLQFEREYDFIRSLDTTVYRKSRWICEAIKEKLDREELKIVEEQKDKELVQKLVKEVQQLKEEIKKKPKVIYMQSKDNTITEEKDSVNEKLKQITKAAFKF